MSNENGSKKIVFNKSMLFSLKAELMKKKVEVLEKKKLPQNKIENFTPASTVKTTEVQVEKIEKEERRSLKDNLKFKDAEEIEACRKAKLALEKKAVLYEHLSDAAGDSQLAGRFLVDFNTKKQDETQHPPPVQSTSACDAHTHHSDNDDDGEWTEFTDCLGRTRKCHKSDLELYMRRDMELMKLTTKDRASVEENDPKENSLATSEKPYLVQKTNDYLHSLREKWEQKEKELLAKDNDVHYQDLLFDEARMHGVAYYNFSTEESERQKQMDALIKMRTETIKAQQEAEEQRKKRDELMAARVAAAKARRRARAGLPPEESTEKDKEDFTTRLLEFLTKQKEEADAKAIEKEKKLKEEQEKEKEKLRETHIREWDVGKDGLDEKIKKFKQMTQEEYVEQQRNKRIDEFAPPKSLTDDGNSCIYDNSGKILNSHVPALEPVKKWSDVRPMPKVGSPTAEIENSDENKLLYFTSKKSTKVVHYKNFIKNENPVPIINELGDEDSSEQENQTYKSHRPDNKSHAKIEPPLTYDYYGPVPKRLRSLKPFDSDIQEAYAQGSESLKKKSNSKKLPEHYDFTFD